MPASDPSSTQPTLRALLGRAELGLRLASSEDDLPDDTLDAPLRWVHSSDLADPTPFLADDLLLPWVNVFLSAPLSALVPVIMVVVPPSTVAVISLLSIVSSHELLTPHCEYAA